MFQITMWTYILIFISASLILFRKWKVPVIENIPGPAWPFPFVGHLLLLSNQPYKTFLDWSKIYGPIFCLQLGSLKTVVLNDVQIMKEAFGLMETSGRPPIKAYTKTCDNKGILFTSGNGVLEQRKFLMKNVRKFCYENSGHFQSIILHEVTQALAKLDKQCGRPCKINREFNASIINCVWTVLMGKRLEHSDSKLKYLVNSADDLNDIEGTLGNLGFFVPAITSWFPNASNFNKQVRGGSCIYEFVETEWCAGCPYRVPGDPQNFKEAWMDELENAPLDSVFHPSKNYFPQTLGDVVIASAVATGATIDWAVLYLAMHPQVQQKLRKELDDVAENTGQITLQDRSKLPYLQAVIHEVFRTSSLGPMGILHYTTEKCQLRGYTIPPETCILANLYSLYHNPDLWDSPKEFRPERFLDETNALVNTHKILPFLAGKRSCIGESMARDMLLLFIGNLFLKFRICLTDNSPDMVPIHGVILRVKPFEVVVYPCKV